MKAIDLRKKREMYDCNRCNWLKRIFCIVACPAVNDLLEKTDKELTAKGP